ncbi:MAG: thioredoxin domain-containing protein, partial [Solirubrobacterales bacterium]
MSNRLAEESSPYLLQHADNPVDWYPWGEEALALAKELDRPTLLSIGYSSCHWCHVMAHESFEDQATAELMNARFINIKVDREERPDIDAIYMEAAQAISGHGGWPLTVFLDTNQVPFFAGTYFPPEPRSSMPSFQQILLSIDEAWQKQRDEIEGSRQQMIDALSRTARLQAPADPIDPETIRQARATLANEFDGTLGGFTGAPKFPSTSVIDFLLGQEDEQARANALFTLGKMADGGIHDQIGGGFARYSVDARWHIPHFEKMLYDNALLARNYLHAWQLTGDERHSTVVRSTLDWMLTEMRGDEGGFASALDADSLDHEGHLEEGAFYAWDIDELREVIESAAPGHVGDFFTYWGVIDHGEFEGKNVLFVNAPEKRPPDEIFNQVRLALYRRRADRAWPARDDKRIASWNALAIAALAEAGAVLGDARYLDAALACAEFVERELRTADGRVIRSWLDGKPGPPGYLEDHAYLAAAYLTLYESTGDVRWFQRARDLADLMIERFEDAGDGGFFSVA